MASIVGSCNRSARRSIFGPTLRTLRVLIGTFLGICIFFPVLFQSFLDMCWEFLKSSSLYKASTFETFWTVFCYAAIEPFITYLFIQHPNLRICPTNRDLAGSEGASGNEKNSSDIRRRTQPRGMKRPSRRIAEAFIYIAPLLLLDLTLIKKFADVSLEAKLASGNYDPSVAMNVSGYFLQPSLHNFTLESPLQTSRALPLAAPSSRRLILELIGSLLLYDALFFVFHLALHMVPLLRTWHVPHHAARELHPQVTNQLSIGERLGLVLLANFSLNVLRAHVLTRTIFVPIFVWLLVEIHSGLDLQFGYEKLLPKGFGGGARKHLRHHQNGGGGLEPFFCWCDDLLQWWVGRSETRILDDT